jgi:hypothetical protein
MPQRASQRKLGKGLKPLLAKQKIQARGNMKQRYVKEKVYREREVFEEA